ncbi:hypothetical protein ACQ4PT_051187 [Festuca glaucescens]
MAGQEGERVPCVAAVADPIISGGGSSGLSLEEKGKGAAAAADGNNTRSSHGDHVEQLMANLCLTTAESKAVVIDDTQDLDLVYREGDFMGKVLSPNLLHIQTISSAMRPAWGNPKGLLLNPVEDNLFVAEFGSKADRDRIREGSLWMVGKHAVLMKVYDADVLPQHVIFDRLAIWARVLALPSRMMNVDRGQVIVEPISTVKRIEADSLGRCWGVDRDENGDLPNPAKRLSVDETAKKSGGSKYGTNATSVHSGTSVNGVHFGKGRACSAVPGQPEDIGVSYPVTGRRGTHGRGRNSRGRSGGRSTAEGRELTPAKLPKKRKSVKDHRQALLLIQEPQATGSLAIVTANQSTIGDGVVEDVLS